MMRKMNKIKGGNKMDYRELKYAIMAEFKSFDKYAQIQQKRTEELIHGKFDKMYENIKNITSDLSLDEINELIEKSRIDEDIPEAITEVLAGIGLIKVVEKHNNPDAVMLGILLSMMDRGDSDE